VPANTVVGLIAGYHIKSRDPIHNPGQIVGVKLKKHECDYRNKNKCEKEFPHGSLYASYDNPRVRAARLDDAPFVSMTTLTLLARAVKSITGATPNDFYKRIIKITVVTEKTTQ